MSLLRARLLCLVVASGSLCAIATCTRRDVPPIEAPETRPAGPKRGLTPDLPIGKKPSQQRPHWPTNATPAAISSKKPPIDAGVDGGADLPPVPDAGVPITHDAGTPMEMPTS
jgi:hypothetical protein